MSSSSSPRGPGSLSRRQWLARSGRVVAASLGAGSLANLMLAARPAHAADYKALVCVFLDGGNDGLNMLVPTDSSRYNDYAAVRGPLALAKGALLSLPGSSYGLHPAMSSLLPRWNARQLAPVFNVGPLFAPLDKAAFLAQPAGSQLIPDSLFSHADQQALWQTSSTISQTRTGWGGRAATALATADPVISLGGVGRFGVEPVRMPLVLPAPGASFGINGMQPEELAWSPNQLKKDALDAMYAQPRTMDLRQAHVRQHLAALDDSARLADLVALLPGVSSETAQAAIDKAFSPLLDANGSFIGELAPQLYQVAKLIVEGARVSGNRQIYQATLTGFDTHRDQVSTGGGGTAADAQAGTHAELLKQLADALNAFQAAMEGVGLASAVTTFTQSDFGRTFAPNSTGGTDHAWGNHHLVLGGSVRGRATYGTFPQLVLLGPDDVGSQPWEQQGRWIPTSSVDQYAATLLRWFGSSDSQLDTILPNLRNFSQRSLGFV